MALTYAFEKVLSTLSGAGIQTVGANFSKIRASADHTINADGNNLTLAGSLEYGEALEWQKYDTTGKEGDLIKLTNLGGDYLLEHTQYVATAAEVVARTETVHSSFPVYLVGADPVPTITYNHFGNKTALQPIELLQGLLTIYNEGLIGLKDHLVSQGTFRDFQAVIVGHDLIDELIKGTALVLARNSTHIRNEVAALGMGRIIAWVRSLLQGPTNVATDLTITDKEARLKDLAEKYYLAFEDATETTGFIATPVGPITYSNPEVDPPERVPINLASEMSIGTGQYTAPDGVTMREKLDMSVITGWQTPGHAQYRDFENGTWIKQIVAWPI